MSYYRKTATAAAIVAAGLAAAVSTGFPAGLAVAAVVMAVAAATYCGTGRKSLIALAVSLIPAMLLWVSFIKTSLPGIIATGIIIATIVVVSRFADLPEARESTDRWVGTLLICEILLFTALAVFCGLL